MGEPFLMTDVWKADLRLILSALSSQAEALEAMAGALEPFAAVLVDVGDDEHDVEPFKPMSPRYRRGFPIKVGDLRRARTALSQYRQTKEDTA